MTNLELSRTGQPNFQPGILRRVLDIPIRIITRRAQERQRRQLVEETLREISRLDALTLVDIGILPNHCRAQWTELSPYLPPRLMIELMCEPDALPAPLLSKKSRPELRP